LSSSSAVAEWLTRRSQPPSRARTALITIVITLLVVSAVLNSAIYLTYVNALFSHNDFRLYYAGAQVGLQYGWSHIYDVNLHQAAVAALQPSGPWYALLTPAPITWVVAPLTVLGYPAAYWVWVALSIVIFVAAVWYARPRNHSAAIYFVWWAALGPLWFSAYEGQVTILAAAGLLAGWRLLETRRDYLAGLVLAVALFKPYLILLLPLALLVSGRLKALLTFTSVAAVAGVAMLVTLQPEGVQKYLAMLLGPEAAGNGAATLHSALRGGPGVLAIQAGAVIAVVAIAIYARRHRVAWPVIVSAVLGSFLLATYWHPQDYLALDAAAAIMLAAGPLQVGVLMAATVAIVSALGTPLSMRMNTFAWLLFAIGFLAYMAYVSFRAMRARRRDHLSPAST
jgi:hypothetical protein